MTDNDIRVTAAYDPATRRVTVNLLGKGVGPAFVRDLVVTIGNSPEPVASLLFTVESLVDTPMKAVGDRLGCTSLPPRAPDGTCVVAGGCWGTCAMRTAALMAEDAPDDVDDDPKAWADRADLDESGGAW